MRLSSVFVIPLVSIAAFASCAPPTKPGVARPHVQAGYRALRDDKALEASQAFRRAQDALLDDPDESLIEPINRGIAEVDRRILEKAIDAEIRIAGDDLARLSALHTLHGRVRQAGADPALETKIIEGMRLRADLVLAPHEQSPTPTDFSQVYELLRYPQLPTEQVATRIRALEVKAWRRHADRATASKHALVRRVHAGLAAKIQGASIEDARGLAEAELAPFALAASVTATATGGCGSADRDAIALSRRGTYPVSAAVTISNCRTTPRTEWFDVERVEYRDEPYQTTESVPYQSCTTYDMDGGCAVFAGTQGCAVRSFTRVPVCTIEYETRTVTRYRPVVSRKWTEKQSKIVTRYEADVAWSRTHEGTTTQHTAKVSGDDTSFGSLAATAVKNSLEQAVAAKLASVREALVREGDQALAAGSVDDAELAMIRVLLLGGPLHTHIATTYRVSADDVRASLEGRMKRAETKRELTTLPDRREPQRPDIGGWVQDALVSTQPPALSRIRRNWYNADLGLFSAEERELAGARAAGHDIAYVGLRFGTPLLARLRSRSLGFGLFDDATVHGGYGYYAHDGAGDEGKTFSGGLQYTAALGFRTSAFAVLAGARASAQWLKLASTTGSTYTTPLYGQVAIGLRRVGLALEAWGVPLVGDDARGATLYIAIPMKAAVGDGYSTSFMALRAEEAALDACAAVDGMSCIDVPALRLRTYTLALGVAFQ
ncbi:MAG: hypothetical protein AB7R00_17440 [Kofleriaceae bacterium]